MRMFQYIPFVALLAVVVALMATAVWHERLPDGPRAYESPCIVSWDENDGDSTLCVLTRKAAILEHTLGRAPRS